MLYNWALIEIYPITIDSEADLAREVARIANLSTKLGYRLEKEGRMLSRQKAYEQISHSASLFKAILKFVGKNWGDQMNFDIKRKKRLSEFTKNEYGINGGLI